MARDSLHLHCVYWVDVVLSTLCANAGYELSQWQCQDGLWLRQYAALPAKG
ncbi:MAG: hypothetical protein IPJ13_26510 [Saprospiraceae bacterium]|nr:hypothetical protein [Saprospiraceae bacterium]